MNEDNQNLRCGCPPDYQMFGGKNYLKILCVQFLQCVNLSLYYFNINISLTTNAKLHVI